MPGRLTPLVNDQVYHVFNRSLDHLPVFSLKLKAKRALQTLNYYQFAHPPVKLSKFLQLPQEDRVLIDQRIKKENKKLVEILAFCLMPNHFHFLLKQTTEGGISNFLAKFENSYTRYSNKSIDRIGPIFLDQFKAVLIETDEQLLHVSRYIHLNPLTSFIVKDFESLVRYPWSSLGEYLNGQASICNTKMILDFFKKDLSYKSFLENQIDYQRALHKIKHLALE